MQGPILINILYFQYNKSHCGEKTHTSLVYGFHVMGLHTYWLHILQIYYKKILPLRYELLLLE